PDPPQALRRRSSGRMGCAAAPCAAFPRRPHPRGRIAPLRPSCAMPGPLEEDPARLTVFIAPKDGWVDLSTHWVDLRRLAEALQIGLGGDVTEGRPFAAGEHVAEGLHRLVPPAVVEVPVAHPVAQGGRIEVLPGQGEDRVRRDLSL